MQGSQSKNLIFFEFSRVSPGDQPLVKEPEDSRYENDLNAFLIHRKSLHCKLNQVQCREYENGLLAQVTLSFRGDDLFRINGYLFNI